MQSINIGSDVMDHLHDGLFSASGGEGEPG